MREAQRNEIEVSFVGDEVEAWLVLKSTHHFNDLLTFSVQYLSKIQRTGLHFLAELNQI